jgi:hypothetical protein
MKNVAFARSVKANLLLRWGPAADGSIEPQVATLRPTGRQLNFGNKI